MPNLAEPKSALVRMAPQLSVEDCASLAQAGVGRDDSKSSTLGLWQSAHGEHP